MKSVYTTVGSRFYTREEEKDSWLGSPIPSDMTGDGKDDFVLIESLDGNTCCTVVHVFELEPDFQLVDSFTSPYHLVQMIDINGDGVPEIHVVDTSFIYWDATPIDRWAPEVVLKYEDGRYKVATEYMRRPPYFQTTLESKAYSVRRDDVWQWFNEGVHLIFFPPPELIGTTLELIYGGNLEQAVEFIDRAWPEDARGKEAFIRDIRIRLEGTRYWPDIVEGLYRGEVVWE